MKVLFIIGLLVLASCVAEREIQVREIVVKVISIDTIYRYDQRQEYEPYAVIRCADADKLIYTLRPKPLPIYEKVGDTKIVCVTF